MINPFACIVNATATALTEASASLAERIEAAGEATNWESFPGGCTSPAVAERNVRELLQQVGVRKRISSGKVLWQAVRVFLPLVTRIATKREIALRVNVGFFSTCPSSRPRPVVGCHTFLDSVRRVSCLCRDWLTCGECWGSLYSCWAPAVLRSRAPLSRLFLCCCLKRQCCSARRRCCYSMYTPPASKAFFWSYFRCC